MSALAELVAPSLLCAVVKADGYGHGDVPVAEAALAAGASTLAVALVEEGVGLREAGVEAPILVLSEPSPSAVGEILHWRLTPTAYRRHFLEALAEVASDPVDVHIKIDTGMHRVGAPVEALGDLLEGVRPPLRLGAVWTHFAVADEDPDYTRYQIERFEKAVSGLHTPRHLANTAGAVLFPEARAEMVRVGLGIYGLHPCSDTRSRIVLAPAMRLVSEVSYLQQLPAGSRPSYGRRYSLTEASTVATVPVGYADGVPRRLSATGGGVLIGGKRYPLAGTVTMDQIVVDVGEDDVRVGDEVVLIGTQASQEISADDWATRLDTITYEIVCGVGPRVPRRYLE